MLTYEAFERQNKYYNRFRLRQKLIELAEEEDRSFSQYINITMKRHVEKLENEKK